MPDEIIEKIVIKPSTELTADEYEHFKDKTADIAVHTFTSDDQSSASLLTETLKEKGYVIKEANTHSLDTDNFFEVQRKICDDSKDSGGLILFISGISKEEGTLTIFDGLEGTAIPLQEIVTNFTSYTCEGLKNKPKIFIFHMRSSSTVQTDSKRFVKPCYSYDLTYDTPGEADILIVYKKSEGDSPNNFISQLCDKIKQHGQEEDIIGLVTCLNIENEDSRPLIISTLTKKFYVTNSEHRGHHYHLLQYHAELNRQLEAIRKKLSDTKASKKKTTLSKNAGSGARKKVVTSNGSSTKAATIKDSSGINTSKRPTSLIESDSVWSDRNGIPLGSGTLSSSRSRLGPKADSKTGAEGSRKRISSVTSNTSGLDGDSPNNFISQLCDKIKQHGQEEDIIGLVTCLNIENEDSRPLIISTLTKKFYVTNSEHRGHHYHLLQYHAELNRQLEAIRKKLSDTKASKKKTTLSKNAGSGARKKVVTSNGSSTKAATIKDSSGINTSKRPTSLIESDSVWSDRNGTTRGSGTLSSSRSRLGPKADSKTGAEGSRKRISSVTSNTSGLDGKPRWK